MTNKTKKPTKGKPASGAGKGGASTLKALGITPKIKGESKVTGAAKTARYGWTEHGQRGQIRDAERMRQQQAVVKCLADGMPIKQALSAANVWPVNHYRWLKVDDGYAEVIQALKHLRAEGLLDQMLDLAMNNGDGVAVAAANVYLKYAGPDSGIVPKTEVDSNSTVVVQPVIVSNETNAFE